MPFERDSAIVISSAALDGIIDDNSSFMYIGSDATIVEKVNVDIFSLVSTLSLPSNKRLYVLAIDTIDGFLYGKTYDGVANFRVVKINLSDFTYNTDIFLEATTTNSQKNFVIDIVNGFLYAINNVTIYKIRLSDFTNIGSLSLSPIAPTTAFIDTTNGFIYYSSHSAIDPPVIRKVSLDTFSVVDTLTLPSGDMTINGGVIDVDNKLLYYGNDNSPTEIIKIDLSTFTRVSSITMDTGETGYNMCIDTINGFLYLGGFASGVGRIIKIDLSTFTRVASINLNVGETQILSASIDLLRNPIYAYFIVSGYLVKVNTGEFDESTLPRALSSPSGGIGFKQDKNILAYMQRLKQSQSKRK